MSEIIPNDTLRTVVEWRTEVAAQRRRRRLGRDDVAYGELGAGDEFLDSTFLYVRGTRDDEGRRPFPAGVRWWSSPQIEIFDESGRVSRLTPGRRQRVRVTVSNGGDLEAPSCSVDLFVLTLLRRFSVSSATRLGVQHVPVGPHEDAQVEFSFTTPRLPWGWSWWRPYLLAVRVCSVTTHDYPADGDSLDAREHRQVGVRARWPFFWAVGELITRLLAFPARILRIRPPRRS